MKKETAEKEDNGEAGVVAACVRACVRAATLRAIKRHLRQEKVLEVQTKRELYKTQVGVLGRASVHADGGGGVLCVERVFVHVIACTTHSLSCAASTESTAGGARSLRPSCVLCATASSDWSRPARR